MKSIVLEVSSWGRSSNGATNNRQYITSDKEYFVSNDKVKNISDEEYGKVIKFIQEKMIGHNYKNDIIYDYGCSVKATFEGNEICVSNVEPLYEDALLLFKEIGGQSITAEDISKIENKYKEYNYYSKKNELIEKSVLYIEKRCLGLKYEESLKIVTNDKFLYSTSINWNDNLSVFPNYEIKEIRILSDDEYNIIIKYIQKHLIGKQYKRELIKHSYTYGVYARYNYYKFDSFNNLKIYKNCDKFLRKKIKFD